MKKITPLIKKWWWLLAIILAAGLAWYYFADKKPRVTYDYVPVKRGELIVKMQATGTVQPEHRLEVKAPLAGRVESVETDDGLTVKAGQTLAWISSTERATMLDAAQAIGAKEVAFWKDVYKPAPLVAPLDGLIIANNVVPGQIIQPTDVAFVMSDHLIIVATVDETDLDQIKPDQSTEITLDGFPGAHLNGKVFKIAHDAVAVNNVTTYQVKVRPDNVPDFLRSGLTANIFFETAHRENALLVPSDSIRKNSVLVARKKGDRPEHRTIEAGVTDGKMTEVLSGISEGEFVARPQYNTQAKKGGGFTLFPQVNRRGNSSGGQQQPQRSLHP